MADHSRIEWTDATWNPITGCSVVSPGCTNCYAMRLAGTRLKHHPSRTGLTTMSKAGPVWNGEVRLNRQWLHQPMDWKKPRMIFVCAHGDLFHENVPDEWILDVFTVMAAAPQHTFQVLTKRAERMHDFVSRPDLLEDIYANWYTFSGKPPEVRSWPLHNVWLGCSAEDQRHYNQRRRWLDGTPAAVKFWSIEPMLGPIDMNIQLVKPNWIIVGGESGPGARPMHPDWARSIRDQCAAADVPFFFKQWGEWGMPTDALGRLDWPYHPDYDRTHWFDSRTCVRPIEAGWSDKYVGGGGAWPPPPFDMFKTPEYLEQVARCPQASCRKTGRCMGNEARAAVTWRGKKAAGRHLDGIEHNGYPEMRP